MPSFRRLALPMALILLSLLLIGAARILSSANRLVSDVRAAQAMLSGETSFESPANQFEQFDALFTRTAQDFRDLRSTVGPLVYLAPLFGWVPLYGGDLANAPALFDLGEQVILSTQDTLVIGRALNRELENGRAANISAGVAVLRVTQTQRAAIQNAQNQLPHLQQARERVDASRASPRIQAALHQLDSLLPFWQDGLEALAIAPEWLGADRPRVYLLVAQNSDELRATGGFITGVSLVRVDQGKVTVSDFQDSYLVDDLTKTHPPAPEPLLTHMYAWQWLFRDSNWSPDFPTSAMHMQALYQFDRRLATDGVIAINLGAVARVLEALGPVTVEPYDERVDSSNVLERIQAYWSSPLRVGSENERWQQRKDFVGRLFEVISRRVMTGDFNRVRMGRALYDMALAKDVLVYLNDVPHIASGTLYTGNDDALMIVDSNLGFNKVDGNISRQADYVVTRQADGSMRAVLSLTYINLSPSRDSFCVHQPYSVKNYAELAQGCYWNYVRIVVPAGSQLLGANTDLKPTAETVVAGRTSFGGFFLLEHGARRTIQFEYVLPSPIANQPDYTLHLERQPGAPPVSFLMHLVLPEGTRMRAVQPVSASQQGKVVYVPLMLDRDQTIVIVPDAGLALRWFEIVLGFVAFVLIGAGLGLRLRQRSSV